MASERASSQRSQALEQEAEKRRAAETRAFAADMARGELEDELRRLRSELHAMRQRSLANEAERNELVGELDDSMARLGQEAREATAALQHRCVLCIVLYFRLFEFCIRYTVVVPISLVQGMMSILITLGRCFTSHNNELRMIRDQHAEEMRVAREQMRNEITAEVRRDLAREKVKMKYVFHSFLF